MTENTNTTTAAGWNFDNSYARLPERFFTLQRPSPVRLPKLAILNERLAASLGLDAQALRSEAEVAALAGNAIPAGAEPLAQAYAGHQFGYFTMLGDGRAILLGEQLTPDGRRVDIQLKGSGITPYSRNGDGRAALGPMLREYIMSEAMFALGIPTTRSLAVVTTGQSIMRENELPGAVLTRVAASHLRVGTFQFAARWGSREELQALADYALERHAPASDVTQTAGTERYTALLREVIRRQAALIAQWQLVGFIHGVMNTDNMTISGETIDYGPCAFMDAYDPATVFSSIDSQGRYAYGNQPRIGAWNLARLAEALLPLLHEEEEEAVRIAEAELALFAAQYRAAWLAGMRAKLGLFHEEPDDEALIQELMDMMQQYRADFTNTFRALTFDRAEETPMHGFPDFADWLSRWQARQERQEEAKEAAQQLMRRSNPAVIPRNHRVEAALEAAEEGDYSALEGLLAALADPYAHRAGQEAYAAPPAPSSRPYRTYCGT